MKLVRFVRILSLWLFWPGVILIAWGELTPSVPHLGGLFDLDKLQHFTAYFGLASMATMVVGIKPRLGLAILGVILFGGALEILQAFAGRDAEIVDFIANSAGALAGLGVAVLFLRLRGPLVGGEGRD